MKTNTLLSLLILMLFASTTNAQSRLWVQQLGTGEDDVGNGISADGSGDIYLTGYTAGSLGGANLGANDAFFSKYDSDGFHIWTRQLGTNSDDASHGVSADGLGNVYLVGHTRGDLGGANAGNEDVFLGKYSADGSLLWIRQIGTSDDDRGTSVAADALGNVYIAGYTDGNLGGTNKGSTDAFVSKFDSVGALVWTRQFGTSDLDASHGVTADATGDVFVTGTTDGNLGGESAGSSDAFIRKYDADGILEWTRQQGTEFVDNGNGASADGLGNVYITGDSVSLGVFVSKYNSSGTLLWTRQLGSSGSDFSRGVSADGLGNIFIAGSTTGNLGGASFGSNDAFISKFDSSGLLIWTRQFGTATSDEYRGVSADGLGQVFVAGATEGTLGGSNAGGLDAMVASYGSDLTELEITADSYNTFRGMYISGELVDTFYSDDSYLKHHPGFTLHNDAPVWLIFDGNIGIGAIQFDVEVESNASTPGLTYTIEIWNYNSDLFQFIRSEGESFATDTIEIFPGNVVDHVDFDGAVRCRIGWRKTGLTINNPWETRLDRLVWKVTN